MEEMKMQAKLWATQNDLPREVRSDMAVLLNQHLADVIDLGLQAKQAHWNVKGPSFIALHELFDEVVQELGLFMDDIAERAVTLGGTALGTARVVAARTRLPEYPLEIASGAEHVQALGAALASFGRCARAAIDQATSSGDADTADLFTGVSRGVDKILWKVEAHAQASS
jgi:starvation-inducible DNA-binding protein